MFRQNRSKTKLHGGGFALIYTMVIFTTVCALVSLAVDYGRVSLDRASLQVAADAAARRGALCLDTSTNPGTDPINGAIAAAATNTIEGAPVVLKTADVQVGSWDTTNSKFTATTYNPNAVQVTAWLSAARGTGVPTLFAALIGEKTCDIHVVSTAMMTFPYTQTSTITGGADPWLAGMPAGTTANFYSLFGDAAPKNSPIPYSLSGITAGQAMQLAYNGNVTTGGQASTSGYGPGGNPSDTGFNLYGAENGGPEHGIANVTAPLGAIIGIYLDDTQPDTTPAPPALDFSTAASRDFSTLSPQLKQPFYLGSGVRSDGTLQNFIVPKGATRLFIGVMDFQQWSDNGGSMQTKVTRAGYVTLVK